MKKAYRVKKSSEIDAIFTQKNSKGDKFFAVYYMQNENEAHFRFALSVGKKYGNAVERNLIKRRVRHIIQSVSEQLSCVRFVVVIKPRAKALEYQQIKTKLIDLFLKSNIMETKNEKS